MSEVEFVFTYNDGIIVNGVCEKIVGFVELPQGICKEIDEIGKRGYVFSEMQIHAVRFGSREMLHDLSLHRFGRVENLSLPVAFQVLYVGDFGDVDQADEMTPLGEARVFFLKFSEALLRYVVLASAGEETPIDVDAIIESRLDNEVKWYSHQRNLIPEGD